MAGADAQDGSTVRRKGCAGVVYLIAVEVAPLRSGLPVAQPHTAAVIGREDLYAVGGAGDAAHAVAVPAVAADFDACFGVPEAHGAVVVAAQHGLTVGRKRDAPRSTRLAAKVVNLPA